MTVHYLRPGDDAEPPLTTTEAYSRGFLAGVKAADEERRSLAAIRALATAMLELCDDIEEQR